MSNDIKTWAAGCLIMLLIFTGTDHGHAGQQTDSKEPNPSLPVEPRAVRFNPQFAPILSLS